MIEFDELFQNREALTAKQRSIVEFILSAPDEAAFLTLNELSRRAGVSEVSVLRLCKALGLNSFVELKHILRKHNSRQLRLANPPAFLSSNIKTDRSDPTDVLYAVCEDDINNLRDMINRLDREKLFACVQGLMKADEVVVFAHDASFLFADYLAYRLNFLRIKCTSFKIGDSDSVQSALARLGKDDYVILLSFPPYHQPIVNLVNFCRYRGIRTMTITDSMDSPAAAPDGNVFLCRTAARYFYNSQSVTVSFINILSSYIAHLLGSRFDEILDEEKEVGNFIFTGFDGNMPTGHS
ncbi:MAG: MurR/RpiR family transcriptional regulator [Clostridia bacterium]|nr:MurR/RpiR family transcriptional regulator [Clostridia bacterium]